MTAKFLASGVAAVAAIGAAATGMTPVAMASTGPPGTQVWPITQGSYALAPGDAMDITEDDSSDFGTRLWDHYEDTDPEVASDYPEAAPDYYDDHSDFHGYEAAYERFTEFYNEQNNKDEQNNKLALERIAGTFQPEGDGETSSVGSGNSFGVPGNSGDDYNVNVRDSADGPYPVDHVSDEENEASPVDGDAAKHTDPVSE